MRKHDAVAEAALLEQCRRRDVEAFGRVVDAYQARVLGFVRRMVRNEEEALDVTQEVFIKAFQAVGNFDGRASLRSWLFRIAYHLCVDRSRRRDRTPSTFAIEQTDEGDGPMEFADGRWDPSSVVLNEELMGVVEEAIGTMSEKLRTVLLMHDREELGYEEIAAAIDVPVGTVKSRLFLARAHLQERVRTYLRGEAV